MQNETDWRPSKYQLHRGKLRASRDRGQVNVGSRLITDLVAEHYDRLIAEHARGDLLDLGCGQAPLYVRYRELVDSITCVDWGSSAHNVCHADVLCDLNEPLRLETGAYDTVIFSDVMEHLYEPKTVLREVCRVLRPGGKLLMNVPFTYWLHEQPHDYYRYTEFCLRRLTKQAGLRVESLEVLGGGPDLLVDVVGKMIHTIRFVGPTLVGGSVGIWQSLRRIGPVRRWIASSARLWPLEYALVATPDGTDRNDSASEAADSGPEPRRET